MHKYISSKDPVLYILENVRKTISFLKTLKSDLGGNNLLKPIRQIFFK